MLAFTLSGVLLAEDLLESGFIRRVDDGGFDYFGPDASVLLSDAFLDTHCFRLVAREDLPEAVGLAFDPVRKGWRSGHLR